MPVPKNVQMPTMAEIMAAMQAKRQKAQERTRLQEMLNGIGKGGPPPAEGMMARRREQLMAQGMSAEQAMQQMAKEGSMDPRLAEMMMGVSRAAAPVSGGGMPPSGGSVR